MGKIETDQSHPAGTAAEAAKVGDEAVNPAGTETTAVRRVRLSRSRAADLPSSPLAPSPACLARLPRRPAQPSPARPRSHHRDSHDDDGAAAACCEAMGRSPLGVCAGLKRRAPLLDGR